MITQKILLFLSREGIYYYCPLSITVRTHLQRLYGLNFLTFQLQMTSVNFNLFVSVRVTRFSTCKGPSDI